ncbi:amino acid adenylation domain-containing protein [Verrucomicrobiales bacterium BCK34]|nr:amino acid adenylation domain-containing protein [Verrucomicrobiales bacterium BCK34]
MHFLEPITDKPRNEAEIPDFRQIRENIEGHVQELSAEAVLAVFLSRYCGQEEVSFGVRARDEAHFTGKSIVVEKGDTLPVLKKKVREAPDEDAGAARFLLDLSGSTLPTGNYEVAVSLSGNSLILSFDANLYEASTIARWAKGLRRLFEAFAGSAELVIDRIDLLDEAERFQMLETWNEHSPESGHFYSDEPSKEFCLHRVFEKQVERTPDRPAAESHGRIWTYRELDDYANQIAHFLLSKGVKPDERIGIYLDRSVEMLAALFGIMKSGGAYVPLDTALPRERLEYMASDSGARLILTSLDLKDEAPVPEASEAVVLGGSEFKSFLTDHPDAKSTPDTEVDSSHLIYVIYTSGSTGMPKGVMLGHNSVVNYLWSIIEGNKLTADDVWFAYTTTAFDPSVKELFSLLFIGGKVVVGPKGAGADGETLARLISESGATRLFATPTTLRILLASGWKGDQGLDILSGGEAISRDLANEIVPLCRTLYNVYGPTEATIFNTNKTMTVSDEPVTIGRALAGCRLYVLDDAGNLCPPQVRGNLFIGGVCLAHGYINKPELTAEKFVPDPFSRKDGAKMYDTGDVAYWTPQGEIVFLGRSDHQVKIRGYRIELGEIEKVLEDHPGVQDSVVVVREDTPGQPRIVAYVIPSGDEMPDEFELRDFMAVPLPSYMIPGWFVPIAEFPLTASRKTDRKALPKPEDVAPVSDEIFDPETENPAEQIAAVWAQILGRRGIRVTDEVYAIGADSLNSVQFQKRIEEQFGLRLPIAEIFESRTPEMLAARIEALNGNSKTAIRTFQRSESSGSRDIAIIGMSGRFPGAGNLEEFWENLINEVESIRDLSEEELLAAGVSPEEYLREGYVARSGGLKGAYDFDNEFFNLSPLDAELLSPQIRLFLKTVWEAMEDAGYPAAPEGSRIGVFAGSGYPNYLFGHEEISDTERIRLVAANGMDYLPTKASYLFGLTGPSLAIQTACSTSLVAINEACEALYAGRCELAIAGASTFSWPHERGHLHEKGMIYSSDGSNRSFDADASGTLFTQGTGAVMLKPLDAALADGDPIHAVIRGVAVNNDGNRKNGYNSPSIEGQSEVIAQALAHAGVAPEEISYVEAHATATRIGDPIEVASLTRAWRQSTAAKQFCALGSVKSNIGHCDAASGIAGLFKVVLSLKNHCIPATLHFKNANPELDIGNSPFYIADRKTPWDRQSPDKPRIGAVSNFGIGGTNAHLILEEAPLPVSDNTSGVEPDKWHLFPFSAHSEYSLNAQLAAWPAFLTNHPDLKPADIAFTLQTGRKPFRKRAFAVAKTSAGLSEAIAHEALTHQTGNAPVVNREPVFLFTGQGSQYLNMARESYENDPVFRETIDLCASILNHHLEKPLLELLFGEDTEEHRQLLTRTQNAQPALFAVSYAQATRWIEWGIKPTAMVGHSIGEYVAATLAGVMRLEDALPLVALRGRLMQSVAPGKMVAIMSTLEETASLLSEFPELDPAASNSHSLTIVSGSNAAVDSFTGEMEARKIWCKPLHTSHAFHSRSMEPILAGFEAAVADLRLSAPEIPYPSNLTGNWISDDEATSPAYYAAQLRSTVLFADGINTVTSAFEEKSEHALFLEMGPGKALTTSVSEIIAGTAHEVLSTLPGAKEIIASDRFALSALGQAWTKGQRIDWKALTPVAGRKRVSLPKYQFDEKHFRSPRENSKGLRSANAREANALLHVPVWKQVHLRPTLPQDTGESGVWLCFGHGRRITSWERQLLPASAKAIRIQSGSDYRQPGGSGYIVRPGKQEDFDRLIGDILSNGGTIGGILHSWTANQLTAGNESEFWRGNENGSVSLFWLAKSLGGLPLENAIPLNVITTGLTGEALSPASHGLPGAISVIQREFPKLVTKVIDLPAGEKWSSETLASAAERVTEIEHFPALARRDGNWWATVFEPLEEGNTHHGPIRDIENGGAYVFTGGLGGLALTIAKDIAGRAENLEIVLINRSSLPPRDKWDQVESPKDRQRIEHLRAIEYLGAQVHLYTADVSDTKAFTATLETVVAHHGANLKGFFHTAGVNRDSILALKTEDGLREVFAGKALAALTLVEFIRKQKLPLDFVALFSSVSAELGYYGGSDYAAANGYLDGLAASYTQQGVPVLAINWALWRNIGMGAELDSAEAKTSGLGIDAMAHSLLPAQGASALLEVLQRSPSPRTAAFRGDFQKRREDSIEERRTSSRNTKEKKSASSSGNRLSHAEITGTMLSLWKSSLKCEDLGVDDNYFEKGGDSLAAISLIAGIEEAFGESIPMSYLIGGPTVSALVGKMGLSSTPEDDLPDTDSFTLDHIVPLGCGGEERQNAPRLFCVHGADGSVLFYKPFADLLTCDYSVYAIEAPMLSDPAKTPGRTITEVAQQYLSDVRKIQPQGPYHFSGYSYGALVAWEMARLAQEAGEKVESVIIFDMFNPARVRKYPLLERLGVIWKRCGAERHLAKRLWKFAARIVDLAGWAVKHAVDRIAPGSRLKEGEFEHHLDSRLKHDAQIPHYIPVPLDVSAAIIQTEDPGDKYEFGEMVGWKGIIPDDVEITSVGGNHLEIFQEPSLTIVAEATSRFLNRECSSAAKLFEESPANEEQPSRAGMNSRN